MVVVVEEGSSPNNNNNKPLRITIFHYVKAIYVVFLASFCFQIACLSAYIGEFFFIKQHLAYLDILASGINVATTVSTGQVTQLDGLTLLERTKALIASFSLGVILQLLAFLYMLDLSIVKSKMQALVLPLLLSLLACYTLLQWFYVQALWPEKVLTGLRALFPNERLERVDYGILLLVQLGLTSLALIMSMAWTIRSIKRFGLYYLRLFHAFVKVLLITGPLQLVHLLMILTFNTYTSPLHYTLPALVVGLFVLFWGLVLHATFQFIFHTSKATSVYWRLAMLFFLCLQVFLVMQLFPPFSTPDVVCPSSKNSTVELWSVECDHFIGHRGFLLFTALVNMVFCCLSFYANWKCVEVRRSLTPPSFQLFKWNLSSKFSNQDYLSGKLRPQQGLEGEVICFANTDSISTISLFDAEKLRHISLNAPSELEKMKIPDPPTMLPPLRTPESLTFSEDYQFYHPSDGGEQQGERASSDDISETTIEYLYHQIREKHNSHPFNTLLNGAAEDIVAEVFTSSSSTSSLPLPPPLSLRMEVPRSASSSSSISSRVEATAAITNDGSPAQLVSLGYLEDGRPVYTIPPLTTASSSYLHTTTTTTTTTANNTNPPA